MPVVTNSYRFFVAVLLGMALLPSVARSQEAPTRHPLEPSDTSSLAATLNSLIDACNELHDLIDSGAVADKQTRALWPTGERIVDCLDLSELPTELRQFMFWYSPPNYWKFQAFRETVNLKMFRAFEERGIPFSLPLRHTYWKHDDQQGPLEIALSGAPPEAGSVSDAVKLDK